MSAKKRAKPKPSLDPQQIPRKSFGTGQDGWYYESRSGVEIIYQARDLRGELVSGAVIRIPWGMLAKSARRCGWKVQRVR